MSGGAGREHPRPDPAGARRGWVHFGVASTILLAAAICFHAAVRLLKIHLVKAAVPSPRSAKVDEHWLESFPARIGPYVLAPEVEMPKPADGDSDGHRKATKDELKELGTSKHPFNWYYSAYYRDTRVGGSFEEGTGRYFLLDVTYYTGLVDPVPHVPEICLFAGGFTPLAGESGSLRVDLPDLPGPWESWRNIEVRRAAYVRRRGGVEIRSSQYYVFSMNGQATNSRNAVRWKLTLPWKHYCYFAKVQAATLRPEKTAEASDRVCAEFLRHAIPEVLRFLPSAADVKRLEETDEEKEA